MIYVIKGNGNMQKVMEIQALSLFQMLLSFSWILNHSFHSLQKGLVIEWLGKDAVNAKFFGHI